MFPDLPPDLPARYDPLPYELRLEQRELDRIQLVVIHCTETPDLSSARRFGEKALYASGTGNSGHYYIDRDGSLVVYVSPDRVAHHVRGYNRESVGIELVNTGRFPHWLDSRHQGMDEPYTQAQIDTLIALLKHLSGTLPNLKQIAGHEDLDLALSPASDDPALTVPRKRDPGPLFPWPTVLEASGLERLSLRPASAEEAQGE